MILRFVRREVALPVFSRRNPLGVCGIGLCGCRYNNKVANRGWAGLEFNRARFRANGSLRFLRVCVRLYALRTSTAESGYPKKCNGAEEGGASSQSRVWSAAMSTTADSRAEAKCLRGFQKAKSPVAMTGLLLESCGAGKRNRTPDLRITNALLYRLSYSGIRRNKIIGTRLSVWQAPQLTFFSR